jgi:hypothetical protein
MGADGCLPPSGLPGHDPSRLAPPMRLTAAKLAAEGFPVFPLVQGQKLPLLKGWQSHATVDAFHIVDNWPEAGYGVGIVTDTLVVLDADAAKGGLEAAAALGLPPTRTIRTLNGGRHYYFRPPAGMNFQTRACIVTKDGTKIPAISGAWGVDIRAKGGLVVAPGTVIDGKAYTVEHDLPIADLPAHLIERLRPAPIKDRQAGKAVVELDTTWALEQARQYLETEAPRGAPEGTRGWTAYQVAARLGDFGVSCGEALALMGPWNEQHGGAQAGDELEKCVEHAYQYRQEPIGRHHPGRVFVAAPTPPLAPSAAPDMSVLNLEKPASALPLEPFGPAAEWIKMQARAKSAPAEYVVAGLLPVVAALIGTTRRVHAWGDWFEPSIIWTLSIGSPSSRKSPGVDAAVDPLTPIENELAKAHAWAMQEYEAKLAFAKQQQAAWKNKGKCDAPGGPALEPMLPPRPVCPRIKIQDATPEAVGALLAEHPRGVVLCRDEMSGFLDFDRYGGGGAARAFYVESYGGRSFTVDRRGNNGALRIPRLSVSITGPIQPEVLRERLLQGSDDGLASRFLMFKPHPVAFNRTDKCAEPRWIDALYRRLRSLSGDGTPVPLAADAQTLLESWYTTHDRKYMNVLGAYGSALGKMPGAVLRLSLVLEHLCWAAGTAAPPTMISAAAVASAIVLVDEYFIPELQRVYADAGISQIDRDAAALARAILERKASEVNLRTVRKEWSLPGLRDNARTRETAVQRIAAAAELLVAARWMVPRQHIGPGRRSDTFDVNRSVFDTQG